MSIMGISIAGAHVRPLAVTTHSQNVHSVVIHVSCATCSLLWTRTILDSLTFESSWLDSPFLTSR